MRLDPFARLPRTPARGISLSFAALALAALAAVPAHADGWHGSAPHGTERWLSTASPETIDPPGSIDTRPFAITDSGDIVGLYITADTRVHGFLLTRGVYTSIDIPAAIRTNAVGVADLAPGFGRRDGRSDEWRASVRRQLAVVGRYDTPDPANPSAAVGHGYLLRDGSLSIIDHPETTTFTVATMINARGDIVGRYRSFVDNRFHGFLLKDGVFTTIDHPGATAMHGITLNDAGDIAGYYADALGRSHGFVLRDGAFLTIDPANSLGTGGSGSILGINAREVVGAHRVVPAALPCGCDGTEAFVYSLRNGTFATYAVPDSVGTSFTGINRNGDVVGLYTEAAGRTHGLYLPRRMQDD